VDGSGSHILSVLAVHGGNLTELPSSAHARGPEIRLATSAW
jgi:hypothetical protein